MLKEYQQRERDEFVAGLKELLSLYERIPDLPAPVTTDVVCLFTYNLDDFLRLRRETGARDKEPGETHHQFARMLSSKVKLLLFLSKEKTCERVKVGERVVPARPEIPARPEYVEVVYEWVCPPSLLELNGSDRMDKPEAELEVS